ncbi:hypothetical protein HDE_13063 [Halotydeus destructor]|nr:hypothetical protein HDE_13063 [Halotydeus destructor]
MDYHVSLAILITTCILSVLIILANGFIVYVISKKRDKLATCMTFVSHQAWSDIIHGLFSLIFQGISNEYLIRLSPWFAALAHICSVIVVAAFAISSILIAFLTLEICRILYFPFSRPMKTKLIVPICWAVTLSTSSMLYLDDAIPYFRYKEDRFSDCVLATRGMFHLDVKSKEFLKLIACLWGTVVPSVILVPSCVAIMAKMARKRATAATKNGGRLDDGKVKLVKMAAWIVLSFVLIDQPIHYRVLIERFQGQPQPFCIPGQGISLDAFIFLPASKLYCLVNFIILCYHNKHFNKELMRILRKFGNHRYDTKKKAVIPRLCLDKPPCVELLGYYPFDTVKAGSLEPKLGNRPRISVTVGYGSRLTVTVFGNHGNRWSNGYTSEAISNIDSIDRTINTSTSNVSGLVSGSVSNSG